MKKPEFKKTYSRPKESGARDRKSFSPKFERPSEKPASPRFEKPTRAPRSLGGVVYRGKEDRLAGTRTRNETRVFSGYAPHTTPNKKSPRAYMSPKSSSSFDESKKLVTSNHKPVTTPDTSWGGVADWYDNHLGKTDDTYHSKVVFPNLLRMLGDISGKKVLDLACGQGMFAEMLNENGAKVTGVDIGKELIEIAEAKNKTNKNKIAYYTSKSDDLFMLKDKTFDIVVCVLALQNIEELQKTMSEVSRVLVEGGKFIFVLNHPSFRNPKQTYWGYNEAENKQYRRVDEYMSESHVRIDMTPGSEKDKKFTVSFHRPLQVYVKALAKNSLAITRLEEWVSHRESERGPRKSAEDKSRKEIPLFMCVEGQKVKSL